MQAEGRFGQPWQHALTRANTPDEFASFREQQIEFFANMVRVANIRID